MFGLYSETVLGKTFHTVALLLPNRTEDEFADPRGHRPRLAIGRLQIQSQFALHLCDSISLSISD